MVFTSALVFSAPASALPAVGASRPDLRLVDAWDRTLALGATGTRPILVLYEDKESSAQNRALKDELGKLAKGDRYRSAIALLAIADVDGYDYWPIRGFVKDAIQEESVKWSTPIYCDWNGAVRSRIGLRRGTSSVILYGRDGRVRLAHEGAMPEAVRKTLISLLREEIGE